MRPLEGKMTGTPSPDPISTRRQRIAELARQSPQAAFTTLAHHIDIDWLYEAYRRTRKDGATGVDGQTAKDYAIDLGGNLRSLLDRAKSGRYQAPPVRRVHIPKGTGPETRPIGIPTFEDKLLQRAVAMVLESVYEQDFLDGSYGFRPGRSAHQALDALWQQVMAINGGWVLEIDIRKFFDALDHRHLHAILRRRVRDGVLPKLIGKWLKAGVQEDGRITHPESGSPQGGVISPLLANAYLHEVLDTWFERTVKPRLKGRASLIRYADDAVLVFGSEDDARRVLDVLPKRFAKYGLTLHPEKTRLVRFQRPRLGTSREDRPGTFDFLGFTHHWGRTLRGGWAVKRRTAKDRFNRSVKSMVRWCREHRHLPIKEQWVALTSKLRGHFAYYAVIGNMARVNSLLYHVRRAWQKWLSRRSDKARIPWERFGELERRFPLPPARLRGVRLVT
jgi:group II intron reverse transcriptase/maturase